jgi:hypothetical protein
VSIRPLSPYGAVHTYAASTHQMEWNYGKYYIMEP